MRKQLPLLILFFSINLLFWSCGQDTSKSNETATTDTETTTTTRAEEQHRQNLEEAQRDSIIAAKTDSVRQAKQQYKVKITPAPKSAGFKNSTLKFVSYEDGTFTFDVNGKFQLGKQSPGAKNHPTANNKHGQFIGLIIDHKPPITLYETIHKKQLRDGGHRIFAYLGRSYNEGVKTNGAYLSDQFRVKNNTKTKSFKFQMPELYCTSPFGKYAGEQTKKILLDFFLLNAKIDKDHKIILTINGKQTFTISKPRAYYLEGLPYGINNIELLLVDNANKKISIPGNPVRRMFTLETPKETLSDEEVQKIIENLDKK